jgi:hypothetical protein
MRKIRKKYYIKLEMVRYNSKKTRRVIKRNKTSKTYNKKNGKYTALIPKTVKATKNITARIIKSGYSFFNSSKRSLKNLSRSIDRQTAKTLHSLTKKY